MVLGSPTASTEQKAAAGVEMTSKILGNVAKTVTQIMVAQRLAAGLSVTAPVIGFIASSVSLAISPLAFYNVAKKFEYADEILKVAEKYKNTAIAAMNCLPILTRNMAQLKHPRPRYLQRSVPYRPDLVLRQPVLSSQPL